MDKKVLLLVDDDEYWLSMLEAVLRSQGYLVLTAGDCACAMAAALRNLPHCVITDIRLAGEDGASLCRRIKASPALNNMPVIMLSGSGDPCPGYGCDASLGNWTGCTRSLKLSGR